MAKKERTADEANIGTGTANKAKEVLIKKRGAMKPADCYLLGKDYDPKTKDCV